MPSPVAGCTRRSFLKRRELRRKKAAAAGSKLAWPFGRLQGKRPQHAAPCPWQEVKEFAPPTPDIVSPCPSVTTPWRCALLDLEPSLLAVVFSACSAATLTRLEVALGSRLGRELRGSAVHCNTWVQVLASEAGLHLAAPHAAGPLGRADRLCPLGVPPEVPKVAALQSARRLAAASAPQGGGWRGLSPGSLGAWASSLAQLHASCPDGRAIAAPGGGGCLGHARRLAMVHFDVGGCFKDKAWGELLDTFQTKRRAVDGVTSVRSDPVECTLDGIQVPLALTLSGFQEYAELRSPTEGLFFGLDADSLWPYFRSMLGSEGPDAALRRSDLLHLSCTLRCGNVERHGGVLLRGDADSRCAFHVDFRHLWHFAPLPNFGLALEIEVHEGKNRSGASFVLDEDLSNAQWNLALRSGTDLAPLAWDANNEFAFRPFSRGALAGKIALVRRGGGCGFAQKALAAQEAGAVGCIIYESEGDREDMGYVYAMGQRFSGVEYPAPKIPCLMVNAQAGKQLIEAARSPQGAQARIGMSRDEAALRRPARSFETFQENVAKGEPVHIAVLVERVELAAPLSSWTDGPRISWLMPRGAEYMITSENTSTHVLGTVHVVGPRPTGPGGPI